MFSKDDKNRIGAPWRNTLIVKLLGKPISYSYLCNRVKQLWFLTDNFQALDLNNEKVTIDSVAAWVHFPGIPLEFYDNEILMKIGNMLGQTLMIDRNTLVTYRGNYASICVEIDHTKPLVPKIFIGGRWQCVEYKGLGMACFNSGEFGHSKEQCSLLHAEEKVVHKNDTMYNAAQNEGEELDN
ncbi:hypothetical protein REPUB_Repub02eG0270200 [Reevesia pubescens]